MRWRFVCCVKTGQEKSVRVYQVLVVAVALNAGLHIGRWLPLEVYAAVSIVSGIFLLIFSIGTIIED